MPTTRPSSPRGKSSARSRGSTRLASRLSTSRSSSSRTTRSRSSSTTTPSPNPASARPPCSPSSSWVSPGASPASPPARRAAPAATRAAPAATWRDVPPPTSSWPTEDPADNPRSRRRSSSDPPRRTSLRRSSRWGRREMPLPQSAGYCEPHSISTVRRVCRGRAGASWLIDVPRPRRELESRAIHHPPRTRKGCGRMSARQLFR
mmetsp:Transcript_16789/g.52475  ORF Transcript_16789/g.52475 Transcript_16789/m.52475 type:complete len:205 (-) Transcript_16789:176-790(-)